MNGYSTVLMEDVPSDNESLNYEFNLNNTPEYVFINHTLQGWNFSMFIFLYFCGNFESK